MGSPRIHLLPPLLANQIAAGEVVERPASVVKELIENSLDAGASQIQIDLDHSGTERIVIRDDGTGINKEDLLLAICRHATSKILTAEDLQQLISLGFRGEALASIAAVSCLSLTSCTQDAEHAWCLQHDPTSANPIIVAAAHPIGTTIEVANLFFNTPARRKFLRSDKTELSHIETVVRQMALSRHDVQFILKHQQSTLLHARKSTGDSANRQRIAAICGQSFVNQALEIHFTDNTLILSGWLGLPDISRSQNDMQYFFVNGRIVRDKLINHAIKMAYEGLLPEGRQACYVLYLNLPPHAVDVNVHPTKHEVRFYESRQVHDFIVFNLKRALQIQNGTPITTETTTPISIQPNLMTQTPKASYQFAPTTRFYEASAHTDSLPTTPPKPMVSGPSFTLLGMTHPYLLVKLADGILWIHLAQAAKALAWQALQAASVASPLQSQPLLLPTVISTTAKQMETLSVALQAYGIKLTQTSAERWLVRELPPVLRQADMTTAITHLLIENKWPHAFICQTLANAAVAPEASTLTSEVQKTLITQVMALPDYTHHPLKPCRLWRWAALEQQFI